MQETELLAHITFNPRIYGGKPIIKMALYNSVHQSK